MSDKAPTKENFYESLEFCITNASEKGLFHMQKEHESHLQTEHKYATEIKKKSGSYRSAVKTIKEVDELKKLLAGKKFEAVEKTIDQAKIIVDEVRGHKNVLCLAKTQVKEAKSNLADYEVCLKTFKDSEFDNIKKLIKNKFIEKVEFTNEKGFSWVYPPMLYTCKGYTLFLGRPEVSISNNTDTGMQLRLPSYKDKASAATLHMSNEISGNHFCLGGYEQVAYVLAAKRQICSLIRLMKEYFSSANEKSIYCTPDYKLMSIAGPGVTDDSYAVYVKENEKLVKALVEKQPPLPEQEPDQDEEAGEEYDA